LNPQKVLNTYPGMHVTQKEYDSCATVMHTHVHGYYTRENLTEKLAAKRSES
jgi:hypothetical protein